MADWVVGGTTNSLYLVVLPAAVLPFLLCSLPNRSKGIVHHRNQKVDHDDGSNDLVQRPDHQDDGI